MTKVRQSEPDGAYNRSHPVEAHRDARHRPADDSQLRSLCRHHAGPSRASGRSTDGGLDRTRLQLLPRLGRSSGDERLQRHDARRRRHQRAHRAEKADADRVMSTRAPSTATRSRATCPLRDRSAARRATRRDRFVGARDAARITGMDGPVYGGAHDPYDVLLVRRDGSRCSISRIVMAPPERASTPTSRAPGHDRDDRSRGGNRHDGRPWRASAGPR